MESKFEVARLDEVPSPLDATPGEATWKPLRHHLRVRAFGVNANVAAQAGDVLVGEHSEVDTRHEELFVVLRGHARFTVAGKTIDAPAGTLVFVRDPETLRGARAVAPDTAVLAVGAEPGAAFHVSPWERKYFPEDR